MDPGPPMATLKGNPLPQVVFKTYFLLILGDFGGTIGSHFRTFLMCFSCNFLEPSRNHFLTFWLKCSLNFGVDRCASENCTPSRAIAQFSGSGPPLFQASIWGGPWNPLFHDFYRLGVTLGVPFWTMSAPFLDANFQ